MNENINLVEILKNVPKGTKLWSPICGECELKAIKKKVAYPICCLTMDCEGEVDSVVFTSKGEYSNLYPKGECVLFPSKDNQDWATFKVPKPHKHFEPYQKVLSIIDYLSGKRMWVAAFFSHYDETDRKYHLVSGYEVEEDEIIPYEGNEGLLGKTVEC